MHVLMIVTVLAAMINPLPAHNIAEYNAKFLAQFNAAPVADFSTLNK